MKRTFNYTGRKKILRKHVSILVQKKHGTWSFDADLKLASYHFPHNAEIWVEAHRQNLWMQWAWGTISALRPPIDRKLTEFDVPDGVLFRVRVVQPPGSEHHKLLGEADALPFAKAGEKNDKRRHLIVPIPDALDQQLWKIDFNAEPPSLLVNRDAKPTWKDMARSPQFISLVYPEVLRQILRRIVVDDKWSDEDEDTAWKADWMKFARNLGGLPPLPQPDFEQEREQWVEEAVSSFCRRLELRSTWDRTFDEEGH